MDSNFDVHSPPIKKRCKIYVIKSIKTVAIEYKKNKSLLAEQQQLTHALTCILCYSVTLNLFFDIRYARIAIL